MKQLILEKLVRVLSEGRVEDVKKKYPQLIDGAGESPIIDFFVSRDPSGNNKYLEWMVKAMLHKPTTEWFANYLNTREWIEDGIWGNTAAAIVTFVEDFHELIPYLVYVEDGVKQGTTDLYQYKFNDSDMMHYLVHDINLAYERKITKEKSEKAKKESDRVYNDSNWFVVRPKSWESSCHYGAGTKWCTTSKTSSSHFKRETTNNFLIYVINKNLTQEDPLYKVAWQIAYKKNFSKLREVLMDPNSDLVTYSGLNLWDAKDDNIARFPSSNPLNGRDYLNTVPEEIKNRVINYIQTEIDERYKELGFVEDPRLQALVEHLSLNQEQADEIELVYDYYGINVYDYDSMEYAIGDWDEVSAALNHKAFQYVDEVGIVDVLLGMDNPSNYISVNNYETIAEEMVNSRMEDTDDDELMSLAKNLDYQGLIEEIDILKSIYEDNSDLEDLENELSTNKIEREEYLSELEKINKEKNELEEDITKKIISLRSTIAQKLIEDEEDYILQNPISWLEDLGWWDKKDPKTIRNAIDRDIIGVDTPQLAADISDSFGVYELGEYTETQIGDTTYYIIRL